MLVPSSSPSASAPRPSIRAAEFGAGRRPARLDPAGLVGQRVAPAGPQPNAGRKFGSCAVRARKARTSSVVGAASRIARSPAASPAAGRPGWPARIRPWAAIRCPAGGDRAASRPHFLTRPFGAPPIGARSVPVRRPTGFLPEERSHERRPPALRRRAFEERAAEGHVATPPGSAGGRTGTLPPRPCARNPHLAARRPDPHADGRRAAGRSVDRGAARHRTACRQRGAVNLSSTLSR